MTIDPGPYRLVGLDGKPHPVLDTPYESIDSAIWAAKNWSSTEQIHSVNNTEQKIGIEVKTINGSWRTIAYA